jgi:hypothetical protein
MAFIDIVLWLAAVAAVAAVIRLYRTDRAREAISRGSEIVATAAGPIEYAAAGDGFPLLSIHGAGGPVCRGADPWRETDPLRYRGHLLVGHGPEVRAAVRGFLDDARALPEAAP